jgi:hypothetical protein
VTLCRGRECGATTRAVEGVECRVGGEGEVSVVLFYEQHGETTKRKRGEDARARHAVTASINASSRPVGPRP